MSTGGTICWRIRNGLERLAVRRTTLVARLRGVILLLVLRLALVLGRLVRLRVVGRWAVDVGARIVGLTAVAELTRHTFYALHSLHESLRK